MAEAVQERSATVLTFGDVNLGRSVGQEILAGRIDFPFDSIHSYLRADIIFANLESQLSDQNGETQHPRDGLIFCGPPEGARTLKRAGITIVSTANNHAFDYGLKGLTETIRFLRAAGIAFVGTQIDSGEGIQPFIIERSGIRFGFIAVTEFVNVKGNWGGRIALFNSRAVRNAVRQLRGQGATAVIASYHGGAEYVDEPPKRTHRQMREMIDAGADVVIGHHPHVPQGIEMYREKLLFYSLGNFVFYQPQHYWTQRGIGVELTFVREGASTKLKRARLLPLRAGRQPTYLTDKRERSELLNRLQALSSVPMAEEDGRFSLDLSSLTDRK